MLLDQDVKIIGKISLSKIENAKSVALETDWHDQKFDRHEKTLKDGRLCTLPYPIRNEEQKHYSPSQQKLIEAVMPVVNEVLEFMPNFTPVRGEVVNLLPGKELIPHIDIYWFHKHSRRIHIPIYTNTLCSQIFEEREHHLEVGNAYEINNRILHSARNNGDESRIHIIIDLMSWELWQEAKQNKELIMQVAE
jgi:hypothetical protein